MNRIMSKVGIVFLVALILLSNAVAAQTATPSTPASPAAPERAVFHEDWNSVSLLSSDLRPDIPVLGQRDDKPGGHFTRELWQLSWRPSDPLDVYIVRPKGVINPPVILYLYSAPADTNRFKTESWCEAMTSGGYAAVGFVSALTGHRLEYRSPKDWFVGDLQEALATSTHDVQMILNFLGAMGDLDMDRVAMFGEGSGGSIAILAAAADSRIKAVEVLTPWGDWPDWLAKSGVIIDDERAPFLTPEFQASVAPLDPVVWLPKVKAQSIRIDNVRPDPRVPAVIQEKIEAAAPDRAVIFEYGDGPAFVRAMNGQGQTFAWLKDQLQPQANTPKLADKSQRVHFVPAAGPPPNPLMTPPSPSSAAVPPPAGAPTAKP
jgi:dienelactone hydrolase